MKQRILLLILAGLFVSVQPAASTTFYSTESKEKPPKDTYEKDTSNIPEGKIIPELLQPLYGGGEHLEYDISWTGGIKLGEAVIDIAEKDKDKKIYELRVSVTSDDGAFSWVYPVKDLHVTQVKGDERFPFEHQAWQKEGYSYEAHKVTIYNQAEGKFTNINNGGRPHVHKVEGYTHNEFSSFMASRLMPFVKGQPFYVPTWADNQRVKVIVEVGDVSSLEKTIFGEVQAREIMPILTFSGTYDQRGDTTVWYTDDECRIPVKVNSKIIIGSLTATLKAWHNPRCNKYPAVERAE